MTTELIGSETVQTLDLEVVQGGNLYLALGVIATQEGITGPLMQRSTAYAQGELRQPDVPNGWAYHCYVAGTTGATPPTWPTVYGAFVTDGSVTWRAWGSVADRDYLIDTTGYTATMEIRQGDYDGATQLECSTADGRIQVGYTPRKWQANTAYNYPTECVPTTLNGYVYLCVLAGTSHATTEPTWPTVRGNIVVDGTTKWRCEYIEDLVDNPRVANLVVDAGPAITETLIEWGRGVYTLKLLDPYGNVALWLDGTIYLRRQATY